MKPLFDCKSCFHNCKHKTPCKNYTTYAEGRKQLAYIDEKRWAMYRESSRKEGKM